MDYFTDVGNIAYRVLLLAFFIAGSRPVSACSLISNPIPSTLQLYPDRIVAFGTVTKIEAQYSEFKLLEVLDGAGKPQDVIRIWDEKDFECNGPFPLGSEQLGAVGDSVLVIAPKILVPKNAWDVVGDYRMPFFYVYKSLFNFKSGTAYYNDFGGLESGMYTSVEMKALVNKYLKPNANHSHPGLRKPAYRLPMDLFRSRDLNGRLER